MRPTTDQLLELPWTWEGPLEGTEDGVTYFEYRIRELPDFFVAGETLEEADRERIPALRAFLESYVEDGEVPPLPAPTWRVLAWSYTAAYSPSVQSGQAALYTQRIPEPV
jgi:predicted RNase H-like HicB family nuclease